MKRAFTVVELLIVVAIVAMLAAIAVPNFLESRQRTNLSRGRMELRTAATALEAYAADYAGRYPYDGFSNFGPPPGYNYWYLPRELSTPVAYMATTYLRDPYRRVTPPGSFFQFDNIRYTNCDSTWGMAFAGYTGRTSPSPYYADVLTEMGHYRLICVGPDGAVNTSMPGWPGVTSYPSLYMPYDPTNGLTSLGDIIRTQVCESGYLNMQPN